MILKDVARVSSDSLLPGTGKYFEAAVDRIAGNALETARASSPSNLNVDDLILLKTKEDFSKSCIGSVNEFKFACELYKHRVEEVTNYQNNDKETRFSEAEDLLETFKQEWVEKKIQDINKRLTKHSRERQYAAAEGKQVSFLPPDTDPLVETLQTFCQRENRQLRVSCESILPATLATLLFMRSFLEIPIDVIYESASGVYQTSSVAEDEDTTPYDFVVTACGAYTLTGRIRLQLKSFLLGFPIHTEEQVILCRPKLSTALGARFGRKISLQDINELHIFNYSSSHEELIVRGQNINKKKTKIVKHEHFEKLTSLFETIDPGGAVNAWSPLSRVLENIAWAKTIGEHPYENLIGMYLREDWEHSSKAPISEAFLELFLVSWNFLRSNMFITLELLYQLSNLSDSFERGAGLIIPDHVIRTTS